MKVNPAGSHKVYRPRQSQTPPPAKEVNPGALFRRRFSAAAAKSQAIFLVDYLVSGLGWIRLSSHECWNQSACSREYFFRVGKDAASFSRCWQIGYYPDLLYFNEVRRDST